MAPDSWSQVATDILAQKYFRKAGVPAEIAKVGEVGVPILDEAIAHVECVLHDTFVAGDHKIIIGLAVSGNVSEGEPLAYFRGDFQQLRS